MKNVLRYPAIFHPEETGYSVHIPDIKGCVSQGNTLEEALANITSALELYYEESLQNNFVLPIAMQPQHIFYRDDYSTEDQVMSVEFDTNVYHHRLIWWDTKNLTDEDNVVIAYHSADNDGVLSATYCNEFIKLSEHHVPLTIGLNYQPDWIERLSMLTNEKTILFIVDLSIKTSEADEFISKVKYKNLIWIDHHASSMETIQNNNALANTYGVRSITCSAAMLVFEFIHHLIFEWEKTDDFNHILWKARDGIIFDHVSMSHTICELVSDHDTFAHVMHDSLNFFRGMQCHEDSLIPSSDLWMSLIEPDCYDDTMQNIINEGEIITKFLETQAVTYVKNNIIKCIINISNNTFRGALLYAPQGDSFSFGRYYHGSNFVIKVEITNSIKCKYKYSVYSSNPEKFDAEVFCSAFGGGGHRRAAGFSTEEDIFADCVRYHERFDWYPRTPIMNERGILTLEFSISDNLGVFDKLKTEE